MANLRYAGVDPTPGPGEIAVNCLSCGVDLLLQMQGANEGSSICPKCGRDAAMEVEVPSSVIAQAHKCRNAHLN